MEKKSTNFTDALNKVREEILNAIFALLDSRNITSVNLYEYWANDCTNRCLFFTCDDDGYGKALYVDTLTVKKYSDGKRSLILAMKDTDDYEFAEWDETDLFEASQMNYLLTMLEDIVEYADEENNGRVLKADETFDDWE
jgi:hypothetical protein